MMDNKRRFFYGRFINIDIDKILSIHENIYNNEPSFFLYMAGVNEKVVLCEDDYEDLCNILCRITDDIENIVVTDDEDNSDSIVSSNISKLDMF
jgi:hypothetical protein